MKKRENLEGQKFNRLTVLSLHHKVQHYRNGRPNGNMYYYTCMCDCGNITIVSSSFLKSGKVKSCGCLKIEKCKDSKNKHKTHGMRNSRLYKEWQSMKSRCTYTCVNGYDNYGGRGIGVCDEWNHSFENFMLWALANGYDDTLTLDRIDVNGNYEPKNCRWVSTKQQGRNRRNNNFITYNGETHCLSEWAELLNINVYTLRNRIFRLHWSLERAFTESLHEEKRRY